MSSKAGYDVLRLIGHGKSSYVSSEYVRGTPLIYWLKFHPHVEKEMLFQWMKLLTEQLDQFHRSRGHPCYQYVNPYSVIVAEDGELYFLDIGAESNEEMLQKMQQRNVREYFLPAEEAYYQKASVSLDIYGIGRTFQYLLSETEQEPSLTRREIIKLQKIISKCLNRHSKKSFQKVSDIQKCIPEYHELRQEKESNHKKKTWILATVLLLAGALFFKYQTQGAEENTNPKEESKIVGEKDANEPISGESSRLEFELGLLYFREAQDYEESIRHFKKVKGNELAENLAVIASRLAGGIVQESKLREALKQAEEHARENTVSEETKLLCYACILEGYTCLTTEQDMKEFLRLGEEYVKLTGEVSSEIAAGMAVAYETCGQTQRALELYDSQMEIVKDPKERELLYEKKAQLAADDGKPEDSMEILREGLKEQPKAVSLWIFYIKMQCEDPAIDRKICIKTIQDSMKAVPDIVEDTEFKKLMREYGFQVKGEKVWEKK